MKNYELLGCGDQISPGTRSYMNLEQLKADRSKREGSPNAKHRSTHIRTLLSYPCWKHMGFVELPNVTPELEEGLSLVEDYFHGDWWTEESVRRVERESPELLRLSGSYTVERILGMNIQQMDRSHPECLFRWRDELRSGIVFGGLLGEWDKVAHICSALDAQVQPEYTAGTVVYEYFQWYLCVAGRLSGQWSEGMDAHLADVKQCRQKRLRDVVAAWEAAANGDQAAFDKAFPAAVKSFVKKKDDPSDFHWVALDETVIWLIASKHGLSFPDMPDNLKAAVMTRESVGLEDAA